MNKCDWNAATYYVGCKSWRNECSLKKRHCEPWIVDTYKSYGQQPRHYFRNGNNLVFYMELSQDHCPPIIQEHDIVSTNVQRCDVSSFLYFMFIFDAACDLYIRLSQQCAFKTWRVSYFIITVLWVITGTKQHKFMETSQKVVQIANSAEFQNCDKRKTTLILLRFALPCQ